MTQKELGIRLGVAQNTISQWELGTREPDIQTLGEICSILGTTLDEILDNPNIPKNPDVPRQEVLETSDLIKGIAAALQQASPEEIERINGMMKLMLPDLMNAAKKTFPDNPENLQALGEVSRKLQTAEDKENDKKS